MARRGHATDQPGQTAQEQVDLGLQDRWPCGRRSAGAKKEEKSGDLVAEGRCLEVSPRRERGKHLDQLVHPAGDDQAVAEQVEHGALLGRPEQCAQLDQVGCAGQGGTEAGGGGRRTDAGDVGRRGARASPPTTEPS